MLDINKYGFSILENIDDTVGLSGEEYEMLVSFSPEHYSQLLEIAEETNTPLTVFAKVAKNEERYPCKSHHFFRVDDLSFIIDFKKLSLISIPSILTLVKSG